MTLHSYIKRGERVLIDNSPAFMTAIGVAGTLTTAYLTGRATYRAAFLIADEEEKRFMNAKGTGEAALPQTTREMAELTWKLYVPAVSVAAITCTAIVMSNRVSTRRATAVATAYALSERAHDEYRTRVVEKLGKGKEQEVRAEMAQSRVQNAGPTTMVVNSGKVMCHDGFSNQFFTSDMETIRRAQNDINAQILHADFATVNDFYDAIKAEGLEHTDMSGDMGWNTDKMLEVDFQTVLYDEKVPCLSISFGTMPVMNPWRFC